MEWKRSNSARGRSIDQAKETDAGDGDGEERSGDSVVVGERWRRGKDADGVESDGSPTTLRESRGWLTPNARPLEYHPSGDIDGWVRFAGVENKSTGSAHTVTDRAYWS